MDLKINLENCLYFLYNKIYFTIEIFYKRNNFIGSIIIQYPIVFVLKRKDLRFCVSHFFFRTTLHEEQISRISMCLLLLLLPMLLTMALLALKKSSQFFLHFICEGKTQHITFITCKIQERVIITCGIFLLFEKKQLRIKPFIILIWNFRLYFF